MPDSQKDLLRKQCINKRKELSASERETFSEAISARILSSDVYRSSGVILSYLSTRYEVDTASFNESARRDGKTVAFPLCGIQNGIMNAFVPHSPDAYSIGKYGILAPVPELSDLLSPECIDLVIVPCSGIDINGNRIGMGGGYYDRYLKRAKNAARIVVAFDIQIVPPFAGSDNDVPMDYAITESHLYSFNKK